MQLTNAIKKAEKAGFEVIENGGIYVCKKAGHDDVRFLSNSNQDRAQCFSCGGVYVKNLTQAIEISKKHS